MFNHQTRRRGLLIVLVLLVCANVEAQRYKLSTSVKSDRARGTFFQATKIATTTSTTTTTTSKPKTLEDNNNTSGAISGSTDKENKVVDDVEGGALLVPKSIAFVTDSQPKEKAEKATEKEDLQDDPARAARESDAEEDDQVTASSSSSSSNTKASDSIDEKDKKALPKRDLPFLIQSSPGVPTLSENLLRGFTPIHEEPSPFGEDSLAFDHSQLRRQQLQRSDTEYNGNTPQVFLTKAPVPQQNFAFSSQHAQASHYQPQPQPPQQHHHSFNPYSSQAYQQHQPASYGHAASASASPLSHQSSSPYNHHTVHENAPTAFKFNTYHPYSSSAAPSSSPHISYISAAPSTKFASLVQSPYLSFASQQAGGGGVATSYPASSITASSYGPPASGQYVGYATTVQPQLVHYQGGSVVGAATANNQAQQQQLTGNGYSNPLLPIPHHHPITSYSFHNPNIIHAHNQNLYSTGGTTGYGKVSNPSSAFNHANGQLSPYAYPVQAAFQVGSGTAIAALAATAGAANVKPYYQYPQQHTSPTVSALPSSSPTLATPQYKYYPGAALSVGAVAAYNINKNEVVGNQLGYSTNGPTIATIKVNPYVPQPFSQISHGSQLLGPQHQTTPFTFAYAKPLSPYSQYQPQQQQQNLNVATYSLAQQQTQPQQFLQQAASNQQQQQQQAYFLSPQSFYSSPNKYQSTFAQIGGTPHKVVYASH